MQMSEQEIVASYKGAKTKRKQITILKDLNCCSREKIIEILLKNGISADELPDKRKKAEPNLKVVPKTPKTAKKPVVHSQSTPKEQPKEKETIQPRPVEGLTKPKDSLQGLLDSLVGYSVKVQGEILKKEKVLEKFTVAIGAIKEAQEIMEGGNGDAD